MLYVKSYIQMLFVHFFKQVEGVQGSRNQLLAQNGTQDVLIKVHKVKMRNLHGCDWFY